MAECLCIVLKAPRGYEITCFCTSEESRRQLICRIVWSNWADVSWFWFLKHINGKHRKTELFPDDWLKGAGLARRLEENRETLLSTCDLSIWFHCQPPAIFVFCCCFPSLWVCMGREHFWKLKMQILGPWKVCEKIISSLKFWKSHKILIFWMQKSVKKRFNLRFELKLWQKFNLTLSVTGIESRSSCHQFSAWRFQLAIRHGSWNVTECWEM